MILTIFVFADDLVEKIDLPVELFFLPPKSVFDPSLFFIDPSREKVARQSGRSGIRSIEHGAKVLKGSFDVFCGVLEAAIGKVKGRAFLGQKLGTHLI